MAEENPSQAGPAPAQDPNAPGGQVAESPVDAGPDAREKELKEARAEAARYRTQLRKFEQADEERTRQEAEAQGKHKELADSYKAKLDAAEARIREHAVERDAVRLARTLKLASPDDVMELIPLAAVEYDADGKPLNLQTLLEAKIAKFPGLVQADPAPATPAAPAAPAPVPQAAPTNPARSTTQPAPFDPKNPPRLGDPGLFKR